MQTKTVKYKSFLRPDDKPAIWLNKKIMEKYRPEMKKYYYDPSQVRHVPGAVGNQVSDREVGDQLYVVLY